MTTIFNLGGTIALSYVDGRPTTLSARDLIPMVDVDRIDLEPTQSYDLSWQHLLRLRAALIERVERGERNFAVLTGTDTAEDVAYFLHLAKPQAARVVLLVAMNPPAEAGETFSWLAGALKWLDADDRPAMSLCCGGAIIEGAVFEKIFEGEWKFRAVRSEEGLRPFRLDERVLLCRDMPIVPIVSVGIGSAEWIEPILSDMRFAGVVVECFAGGDVPHVVSRGMTNVMRSGRPVVIASRSRPGLIHAAFPGLSGASHALLAAGALNAGRLDSQRARLRLALALAADPSIAPGRAFSSVRE